MNTIRKGSTNVEAVVMLQELLNRAGFLVAVDGVFATGTDQAVRDDQAASGLIVDGIVGEQTWLKLLAQAPEYLEELESASWGLFQVMGYQWKPLGYPDVRRYTRLMDDNEGNQLRAFTRSVQVNDLTKYLKGHQWASFASRYNGPGYKTNRYDEKLERAYRRYAA